MVSFPLSLYPYRGSGHQLQGSNRPSTITEKSVAQMTQLCPAQQLLHLRLIWLAQKQQLPYEVCATARSVDNGKSPPGTLKTSNDWVPVAASLVCPSHSSNLSSIVGGIPLLLHLGHPHSGALIFIIYMNRQPYLFQLAQSYFIICFLCQEFPLGKQVWGV